MKLAALAVSETVTVELKNPVNDSPLGIFITTYTPSSAKWAQLEKKYADPKAKKGTSILIGKKGEKNEIVVDDSVAEQKKKVLISAITEITGIDDLDNSPAAYKKFLSEPAYEWILGQVSDYLNDLGNLLKIEATD